MFIMIIKREKPKKKIKAFSDLKIIINNDLTH